MQSSGNTTTNLKIGQRAQIRLHHPLTRNFVGEALFANYLSPTVMTFELTTLPVRRLRVTHSGTLDFSEATDETTQFSVEVLPTGPIYISCRAHADKINVQNGAGWYVGLTRDGRLRGDFDKSSDSQWMLVAATETIAGPVQNNGAHFLQQQQHAQIVRPMFNRSVADVNSPFHSNYIGQSSGAGVPSSAPLAVGAPLAVNGPVLRMAAGVDPHIIARTYPRDALLQWLQTETGAEFLEGLPDAKRMLFDGSIRRVLHRPDWPSASSRYHTIKQEFSATINAADIEQHFPHMAQQNFFEQGYYILRNVVSHDLVSRALTLTHFWVGRGGNGTAPTGTAGAVQLMGEVQQDADMMALFSQSPLQDVVQKLLGVGEVTFPAAATPVVSFPTMYDPSDSSLLSGTSWTIDGFTASGDHSPYTLLVGVALSDMHDPYCGNFCVHAGTQLSLQVNVKEQIEKKSALFSSPARGATTIFGSVDEKPTLGQPQQLMLKKGDAFICSQKCATQRAPNCGGMPSTIVYFKISHVDHNSLKSLALDGVWVEFGLYNGDFDACISKSSSAAPLGGMYSVSVAKGGL